MMLESFELNMVDERKAWRPGFGQGLTKTPEPQVVPGNFVSYADNAVPGNLIMRADLVPLFLGSLNPQTERAPVSILCAQMSAMGRVSAYGCWSEDSGWTPWSPHWEAVVAVLWARQRLQARHSGVVEDTDNTMGCSGQIWAALQESYPGLPDWHNVRQQSGAGPLMTLLERGVAAYPAIMWLTEYASQHPADCPNNLEALLVRERCRLWRTVDPSENALQQVVKAVYAVQAMRRCDFDCRLSAIERRHALNLPEVLQSHWQQVPEPLRDDHLIKALRDSRPSVLAEAWYQEAQQCRQRGHYADAFRAMTQSWSALPDSMTATRAQRWRADAELAESDVWTDLLDWHGVADHSRRGSDPLHQRLLLNL